MKKYQSFREFYPFYRSQHSSASCRALHVAGSLSALALFAFTCWSAHWMLLLAVPVVAYGFAWIGHFFIEKNTPATFTYPLYSFIGDWVMIWQILTGRISLRQGNQDLTESPWLS